jgi:hypothetical protein
MLSIISWAKKANAKIAGFWVQQNKSIFEHDFSHIGVTDQAGGALLDQESANMYKFHATGRVNCVYCLVTIELKRRQDLLTMLFFSIIWPEKDRISIEIPVELAAPLPVVFAVVRAKEAKTVYGNNSDLKALCKKIAFPDLEGQYIAFGENTEAAEYLLTAPVVSLLKKNDSIIQMIQVTDQSSSRFKSVLRADFLIPHNFTKDAKEFQPLIKMLFYMVDSLTTFRLSAAARAKAEKERALLDQLKAKEDAEKRKEEANKKKDEERKKELERRKALPKDKQVKLDEKDREKDVKKRMSRKVMKIG